MFIHINNEKVEMEPNSTAKDLAKKLNLTSADQALAVNINGQNKDLSELLQDNDKVSFISFDSKEGKEIFWHTSAHVLAQAIARLYPKALTTIGPPIENGFYYDFANLTVSEADFGKIEKEVKKIIAENHIPQRHVFDSKKEAIEAFGDNPYKKELIEGFEEGPYSSYSQGEFSDLCRGPHLPQLSKIKAFKVLKTSGAYWHGDQTKEMLTRIYAISFPDKSQMQDYLTFIEEAKKRDHKKLGQRLDLFMLLEEAPGSPFFLPHGLHIWNKLLDFLRDLLSKANYKEIKTPLILTKELWETSGHWFHYKENMYSLEIEGREFAIKPMNCPGCMLYYKTELHSYRQLPLRVAEIGHVHRHELSGAINGLFRVRSFHQDDAHIFMKPEDIKSEIIGTLEMAQEIYQTFDLPFTLELSTRPEKSKTVGTDAEWEMATEGLKSALDTWGKPYRINEGDGAFYGPKIDLHIKDALGRFWQCGTIQLDMSLPEKFKLEYIDSSGEHKRPIMIHRALFGSVERFFGILIEHFGGNFPLWISPRGVQIITVAERHIEYARELAEMIRKTGATCDIDDANESVGKKIRNAEMLKYNYMLTVGDQEISKKTIVTRTRNNIVHGEMRPDFFINKITEEINNKEINSPFIEKKD